MDGDVEVGVGVAIVWSWREIDKIHQLGRIAKLLMACSLAARQHWAPLRIRDLRSALKTTATITTTALLTMHTFQLI